VLGSTDFRLLKTLSFIIFSSLAGSGTCGFNLTGNILEDPSTEGILKKGLHSLFTIFIADEEETALSYLSWV
jgi:hypothetical protein